MKQLLFILIAVISFSCSKDYRKINPEFLDETKHELVVFNSKSSYESESKGSFFLIGGNYSSSTKEYTNAVFMWKSINGEYVRSTMDLNRIRLSINDSVTNPYVVFFGVTECHIRPRNYQFFIDRYVNHAVIYCNSKDFPKNINLLSIQN